MLLTALLAMAVQAAQPADIVVTGKRLTRDEARVAALAHVRAMGSPTTGGQFARWNDPLCLRVDGVAEPRARYVRRKVEAEARLAGAALAGQGCATNALILFATDGRAQMALLARRRAAILQGLVPADKRRLMTSEAAIRWWYHVRVEGADGRAAMAGGIAFMNAVGTETVPTNNAPVIDGYGGNSLIAGQMRVSLDGATVLVDAAAARGRTMDAIAAYVATVLLARARFGAERAGADTILALFDSPPGFGPADLTAGDRAWLAALYAVPANRAARVQRKGMVARMTDALAAR